jgi:hypothetical protein
VFGWAAFVFKWAVIVFKWVVFSCRVRAGTACRDRGPDTAHHRVVPTLTLRPSCRARVRVVFFSVRNNSFSEDRVNSILLLFLSSLDDFNIVFF